MPLGRKPHHWLRLQLWFLLELRSSPIVLSALLLFALSKPVPARHKKTAMKTHTTQTATCKCPHISCPGSTNGGLQSPSGNKIQT